ncbi:trimeric intracellular cation channel family protein [Siphonobacter sp. SORGH_AS_1065]|uniref:trimeric intracellular cation channel family protein n=1 Tax=Siphonobacter sp. SORGH_AS_1065 TaxID=3041795 RepID=UPI0027878215|nr:trimeric intracellular cation channel family protein [Siphonobacter sp. SORGH_AS_1065]MDQ1085789.1 putative membrane protein YeiH [Siphonobacter sp. SORGH_AS_1065]
MLEYSWLLDWGGTISFAVSGAFAAMQRRLDPFGVLIIAFVTAVGGGTVRDVLLGNTPVSWMRTTTTPLLILGAAVVSMFLRRGTERLQKPLLLFDSLGLGFFTIVGIEQASRYGLPPGICIALGVITGCFGGVIRDILLNDIPIVFHKEIYATASIIGGGLYYLMLELPVAAPWAKAVAIGFIFVFRLLVVRYQWALPRFYE